MIKISVQSKGKGGCSFDFVNEQCALVLFHAWKME